MPIEGIQKDRIGDLLEELVDSMMEPTPAPVVNVEAPRLTAPPATVNVTAYKPGSWTFTVTSRDSEGRIITITAEPK